MSKEIIFLSIPRAFEPPYEEPVNMLESEHFHENEKNYPVLKDNRVQEAQNYIGVMSLPRNGG